MNCWDIMGENVSGAAHAGQDVPLAYQSWNMKRAEAVFGK